MENIGKKLTIPALGLACFLTFGVGQLNAEVANKDPKVEVVKKDSKVENLVNVLSETDYIFHEYTRQGKTMSFEYSNNESKRYLGVSITQKESVDNEFEHRYVKKILGILDEGLNNLDGEDTISYHRFCGASNSLNFSKGVKFKDLSSEVREKIKEKYNTILNEAPVAIKQNEEEWNESFRRLGEYAEKLHEEQEKNLETNIVDILK